jgi:hypothetical protein
MGLQIMLKHIKSSLKNAIENGIPFPHAYDPVPKKPSFRLLCAYTSFLVATASVVALHFVPVETATWTAIGFYGLCMVFYMLKRLTSAKIDLDDRSLELSDNSAQKTID